jgi:hypothetical protein
MGRLTSKSIGRAIKAKYGVDGVFVSCLGGMCNFYSDTNEYAANVIGSGDSGVYVCRINHLTIEQWLDSFIEMWQENGGELKSDNYQSMGNA